jgi:hypothetical protein
MGDREPPDAGEGSSSWGDAVGRVGSQLAQSLGGNPPLAAISLILLIFTAAAALVAMQTGSGTLGLGALVLLALAALTMVILVVRAQEDPKGKTQSGGSAGRGSRDDGPTAPSTRLATDGAASDYEANLDALDAKRVGNIRTWLSESAGGVAKLLDVPARNVRASIYVHDATRDQLRIVPTLTHHIDGDSDEMTLAIPVGVGAAGRCFQAQMMTVAKLEEDWGKYTIPASEFRKVDPNLRWIIALPVLPKQKTVMVFNVDGLQDSPSLEQLDVAARTLFGWATLIHRETGASAW